MKMKLLACAVSAAVAMSLAGCSKSDDNNSSPVACDGPVTEGATLAQVLETNADIAFKAYSDSVDTAKTLKTALATLETTPTVANLTAAKNAWLVAREPYGQTEVYRFRASPIDDDPSTVGGEEDGPEGDINAWPLGEALIDYVKTGDDFGTDQVGVTEHSIAQVNSGNAIDAAHAAGNQADNIIGNTAITIDAALLANTASAGDEHDVIAGYHAIEFLLWGQDLNQDGTAGNERDSSGGQRPITDFQADNCTSGTGNTVAADICNRRHTFLEVAVDKLIADLEGVRDEWAPDADNYRKTFVASGNTGLLEILTGMGSMAKGELAGERMKIALLADSQEDEHSCFSDNTHRDIWLNAEGVANSFCGDYAGYDSTQNGTDDKTTRAVSGVGIYDYLYAQGKKDVANELNKALGATEKNYMKVDSDARNGKPFDNVIQDASSADADNVKNTITALSESTVAIQKVAKELGLDETALKDAIDDSSDCDTSSADAVNGESC